MEIGNVFKQVLKREIIFLAISERCYDVSFFIFLVVCKTDFVPQEYDFIIYKCCVKKLNTNQSHVIEDRQNHRR